MERQINLSEVAEGAADAVRQDLYHSMPGNVVAYDEGTELVDVQPGTNDVRTDLDTGARDSEPFEVLRGVPVAWPRFGGFVIKGSLGKYDPVHLVAFDLDPTPWRKAGRTLKPVDPGDVRRHGGGYWFALPVDLTLARTPGAVSGKLTIGAEGQAPLITIDGSTISLGATPSSPVALSQLLDVLIKALIQAAGSVPPGPAAGAAVAAALVTFGAPGGPWILGGQTCGAEIVKGQ